MRPIALKIKPRPEKGQSDQAGRQEKFKEQGETRKKLNNSEMHSEIEECIKLAYLPNLVKGKNLSTEV